MSKKATKHVGPQFVRGQIAQLWEKHIDNEVLNIEADSVVGAAVVDLCTKAEALLGTRPSDVDDEVEDALEPSVRTQIIAAVVEQVNVWYFG